MMLREHKWLKGTIVNRATVYLLDVKSREIHINEYQQVKTTLREQIRLVGENIIHLFLTYETADQTSVGRLLQMFRDTGTLESIPPWMEPARHIWERYAAPGSLNGLRSPQIRELLKDIPEMISKFRPNLQNSPRIFANKHAGSLSTEANQREGFRITQKWIDKQSNPPGTIKVYHGNPGGAPDIAFHNFLQTGSTLLWTWDTKGRLAIGDSHQINKHSIVAQGERVRAAGEVKFHLTPRMGLQRQRAGSERTIANHRRVMHLPGPDGKIDPHMWQIMIEQEEEVIAEIDDALGKLPADPIEAAAIPGPAGAYGTVTLDFGSGHYCPSGNVFAAVMKWRSIGYRVRWGEAYNA